MTCLGCCTALKPRYKRLVDDIFPVNPDDGLVKNNMDKLTFYALSSPEKLDRIGEYLATRLSRDVQRRRTALVKIAMEALDKLLVSCHDYSLNLFVESFLKMVQKLLECDELELQILATSSFVKFTNIEEDTPSYHRRYDFFVSKFSSMCHSSANHEADRARLRTAGLKGLQGVVRKTVTDELQVNIWEPVHMDKIVPSLLFNMHDQGFVPVDLESPRDEEHPAVVAETVFRDLICRGSYGNIKAMLKPILVHLDNHNLWTPNTFAVKCFKIIMFSVQQQYAYLVIHVLLLHLDNHIHSDPSIKVAVVDVLYKSVLIAAGSAIGPSVLDVFNTLLRHLRISLDNKSEDETRRNEEKKYEDCIVNTIGEFANNLPDYQKIEIMMFIMAKFPQFFTDDEVASQMDSQLQIMLLKTLLKVATKYKTVSMSSAFPPEFLHPLLRMSLLEDPAMRIMVQEILHTLIDRHDNTPKLKHVHIPKDVSKLGLKIDKIQRQDSLFMKKSGMQFYWYLLENVQLESNKVGNFEALYCTMSLICVEMGCKEILVELIRLALDMQALANIESEVISIEADDAAPITVNISTSNQELPLTHKCAIHSIVAAFVNLVAQLSEVPQLQQYVDGVVETRWTEAKHLLPDFAFNRKNRPASFSFSDCESDSGMLTELTLPEHYPQAEALKDKWLFQQDVLTDILASSGFDVARLSTPFTQKPFTAIQDVDGNKSFSDIQSINIEVDSVDGSPLATRRRVEEEVTVESLKKMLAEDSSLQKEQEDKRRQEIIHTFRTAPFEEIVARSEAKSNHFHNKLNEILDMVSKGSDSPGTLRKASNTSTTVFDIHYPDLYVY